MRRFHSYWKPILVSMVFLLAFTTFLNSGRVGYEPVGRVLKALYFSISLFILGGLDIGLPDDPSRLITALLWLCYFFAPLMTASFVYDFIQNKLLGRIPRHLSGHTILCGLGRNGHLIYELIRETLPKGHKLVIIEKNETNPYVALVNKDPYAWLIQNDFARMPVLESARIRSAQRIIFSTNLDLENLNAVIEVQSQGLTDPQQAVFCHLGDLEMLDNLKQTLFKEETYRRVRVFNGYQCATRQLYERLQGEGMFSVSGTVFVLFGYGRFAHMLFMHITTDPQRKSGDEVIIVTEKMASGYDLNRLQFDWARKEINTPCTIHSPIIQDMHNPEVWAQVDEMLQRHDKPVLAFVCRDNDVANMDLAISIKLKGPQRLQKATFICRMYAHTVQDLNDMLDHRLTPHQMRDVILFPLQAELKKAFYKEIFTSSQTT
jgi:hypothetical protein